MQYDLKQFEQEYGQKSDNECVELMKQFYSDMTERGEKLVGLLWYFEKSKRYKKFDGYKNASFKDFVWEVAKIPYNRYRELAYAYNWFPEESRELGPHVIQSVRSKVGVVKIPQVLKEIKTKVDQLKDPAKKREAVLQIVEKYTPKRTAVKGVLEETGADTKAYWRKKYEDEHALRMKEKSAYEKEIAKLEAQLEKQKGPVKAYLAIKDTLSDTFKQAEATA